MTYTIYNIGISDSVKKEEFLVWSVLPFADKLHIVSEAALVFHYYQYFPALEEKNKIIAYGHFKEMHDRRMGYEQAMGWIKYTKMLRNMKRKNGQQMQELKNHEKWMREQEGWFMRSLADFLREHHLEQVVPLATQFEDGPESDFKTFLPSGVLQANSESSILEHYLTILTNALSAGELLILDHLIEPLIKKLGYSDFDGSDASQGEKVSVYLDKLIDMPICFSLKTNEIKMTRDQLKEDFSEFHEALSAFSSTLRTNEGTVSPAAFKDGIKHVLDLQGALQTKIDSNPFVIGAKNAMSDLQTVILHLAFTTNKGLLEIIHRAGMLDEETFLQACTLVEKESGLNYLRPFVYISY